MLDPQWLASQLRARGLVSDGQLRAASSDGGDFCFSLLSAGAIEETALLRFLGLHFNTRYVSTEKLSKAKVPQWVLDLLPVQLCERAQVVPVRCDKQKMVLSVVTPDPSDPRIREAVQRASRVREVHMYVALPHAIEAALRKWYRGDIHAFSRMEQKLGSGYSQMLDIYDQRAIDLGGGGGSASMDAFDADLALADGAGMDMQIEQDRPGMGTRPRAGINQPHADGSADFGIDLDNGPMPGTGRGDFDLDGGLGMDVGGGRGGGMGGGGMGGGGMGGGGMGGGGMSSPGDRSIPLDSGPMGGGPGGGAMSGGAMGMPRSAQPTAPIPAIKPQEAHRRQTANFGSVPSASSGRVSDLEQLGTGPAMSPSDSALIAAEPIVPLETFVQTVSVLVSLLEMGQGWRQGHSAEVARLVALMGQRVGLPPDEVGYLKLAAYLHELGKPAEPHLTVASVAESPELKALARRVYMTPIKLTEAASLPAAVTSVLAAQYERTSGDGVPGKLSGREVPLGARLLAVVDVFCDLMANPRAPGGRAADQAQGLERLRQAASARVLDANAVDIFCQVTTGDALREQLLGDRPRILIIDGDAESTTVLELKLVAAGYDVRVYKTTAEAAREVLGSSVDLILSEVRLEPVDGFGFLERIRADPRTRDIPLIFVSDRTDADDVNRGFELGAADYIVKPYTPELLVAKVKMVLEQRPPAPGTRGVSGSLREMSLPDILQILSAGKKSGQLRLRFPDGSGEIYLDGGQVVNAVCGSLRGTKALYRLLPVDDGEFTLDPNAQIPERVIHQSTEALVLEAMRRFDEGGR
ncbi:MAG: DUF4388 domain-containing protein [Myxococcales bacterium]|nr:DUF4388 domain-containing protein [Myxococcales bacterium]